jgi:hypothetical protein
MIFEYVDISKSGRAQACCMRAPWIGCNPSNVTSASGLMSIVGGADEHPEKNTAARARINDRQTGIFDVSIMRVFPVVILQKLVFNPGDYTTHTFGD